jgi:hypothetical protein
MIFNLDGTAFEAELFFTFTGHEIASLGPLNESATPGTLLETSLHHFIYQLSLFHFVNHLIFGAACQGMGSCVTREAYVLMALFTLKVFKIFIIIIIFLGQLIQK